MKLLASIAATLALLSTQADAAITLTPLQDPVHVAPGGHALVDFKVDFGADPLELISFDLGLVYDAAKLSLDAAPTFQYAGPAPDFSAGAFIGNSLPGAYVMTWALGAPPFPNPLVLPTFAGEGVLHLSFTALRRQLASGAAPLPPAFAEPVPASLAPPQQAEPAAAPPAPPFEPSAPPVEAAASAPAADRAAPPAPPFEPAPELPGEPLPPLVEAAAAPAPLQAGWEQRLGARAFVWVGAITLALAGIFLVRYSIEEGYLSEEVRVILAAVFGFALIGIAERIRSRDDRVAQALAAAGVAALYGALFSAVSLYEMISKTAGGGGAIALTAFAIGLSLRHGPFVAGLAFVGGFVSPALIVSNAPNAPVLFGYLLAIAVGTLAVIRLRGWWPLGWGVLAGTAIWAMLWIASRTERPALGLPVPGRCGGLVRVGDLAAGERKRESADRGRRPCLVGARRHRRLGGRDRGAGRVDSDGRVDRAGRPRCRPVRPRPLGAALPVHRRPGAAAVSGRAVPVVVGDARQRPELGRRSLHLGGGRVRWLLCRRRLRPAVERGAAGLLGGALGRYRFRVFPAVLVRAAQQRARHTVGPDQHRPRRSVPGRRRAPDALARVDAGWHRGAGLSRDRRRLLHCRRHRPRAAAGMDHGGLCRRVRRGGGDRHAARPACDAPAVLVAARRRRGAVRGQSHDPELSARGHADLQLDPVGLWPDDCRTLGRAAGVASDG